MKWTRKRELVAWLILWCIIGLTSLWWVIAKGPEIHYKSQDLFKGPPKTDTIFLDKA